MEKSKQKINMTLKFEVEMQENSIQEKIIGHNTFASRSTIKRIIRNYCIKNLAAY